MTIPSNLLRASRVLPLVSIAFLALLPACGRPPSETRPRGLILLSVDTLRADHLGAYGYERDTSPHFDDLAQRGVLFEKAIVPLPGTLPSHMSMLTGLYPPQHGVYPPDRVLPQEISLVQELLRADGFRTAGFTEGGYVSGRYGFERGFDEFSDETEGGSTAVVETLRRGLEFLDGLESDDRFFLFLHTYSVHDPYSPPEPFASEFWKDEPPEGAFPPNGRLLTEVNRGKRAIDEDVARYFRALYDGGIRYFDSVFADFLRRLDERGFLDDSVLVVTSDHGEEFLDHGKLVHEQIYDENLHVPLLFVGPGVEARRVEELVESIDLKPTILELLGLDPPRGLPGRSLAPLLRGAAGSGEERSWAWAERFDSAVRALYYQSPRGLFTLIEHSDEVLPGGGKWIDGELVLSSSTSPLTFDAHAFQRERTLRISAGDELVTAVAVPRDWRRLTIPLPDHLIGSPLTLRGDSCDSPRSLGLGDDDRCLSIKLRSLELKPARSELFDLSSDPEQTTDRSEEFPDLVRSLREELSSRDLVRLEADDEELSPELEKRLRALGYLQ